MKRSVDPLYDQFSGPERFALAMAALGRKDLNEVDRIKDTCPLKTYRMEDAAYSEAMRCMHTLTLETRCRLLYLQGIGMGICGLIAGLTAGSEEFEGSFPRLSDKLLDVDVQIRSTWAAWEAFCKRIGVEPEAAMRIEDPLPESFKVGCAARFFESDELRDLAEADDESVALFSSFLNGYWERVERYPGWKRAA